MPLDLTDLNEQQYQAVCCVEGPLLVLAGAGSGKTRVLTYRIAHLVEDLDVSPYQIMAITFTNKAAAEMRERLGRVLPHGMRGMIVATFHSLCVRLLRQDAGLVGYSKNFTIYDESDSKRLLKDIYEELNIDPRLYPINGIRQRISMAKNELVDAGAYEDRASNGYDRLVARVYARLQERLRTADAMDFDDLLVNAFLLLRNNPDLLAAYQRRFLYLHIDEYQDTNAAQYAIAQLLAAQHHNIMVVGDDDQSIYSWRGADIRNILEFEQDYPEATVIKLEQNYRSTQTILEAANAVIANNTQRKAKRLFTQGAKGEKLALYQASDERDEGRWIASEIERLHKRGVAYRDCVLFYRTNAQSRVLEDMLLRAGIPYRIVGGTRFFDRAEIRDVMAYLRLVVNPSDDMAARRVINVPRRGIGKARLEQLDALAFERQVSLLDAVRFALDEGSLPKTAHEGLAAFMQLIDDARLYQGALRDIVEMIVERSGLVGHVLSENKDDALSRIENIQEFYGVAQEFEETHGEDEDELLDLYLDDPRAAVDPTDAADPAAIETSGSTVLSEPAASAEPLAAQMLLRFTEWLSLRSDLDSLVAGEDYLTLMTIHSAKGLEFPVVFISGMEESLFPHIASSEDPAGLEEERRLAYVAITRARELLYLTHTQIRSLYGNTQANPRSRFIAEIPAEHLTVKGVGSVGYAGLGWEKRGDRHGIFGSGTLREHDPARRSRSGAAPAEDAGNGTAAARDVRQERESSRFEVGDRVDHKTFGRGVVSQVDGDVLFIRFDRSGDTKKLLKGYAPLVRVS